MSRAGTAGPTFLVPVVSGRGSLPNMVRVPQAQLAVASPDYSRGLSLIGRLFGGGDSFWLAAADADVAAFNPGY